jgi:hypothetical protein
MAIANQVIENLPSISVTLDDITFQLTPGILTVTGSGGHHMLDEVTLSTSDTNLSKGNVGTIGRFFAKNLSATVGENILIGSDGTLYPIMLKPGEWISGRWNAAAFHAKAAAGTPKLKYMLVED